MLFGRFLPSCIRISAMAIESGYGKRYCLRLADGQGWHLIAAEEVRSWVEKLASLMELEAYSGNHYPKLIFIRRETDKEGWEEPTCCLDPTIQDNLPRTGWIGRNLAAIQIWSHPKVPDVICEMGHQESHVLDILRMSLSIYPIFEGAQGAGGLPFHAALIERDGCGILLAGPGDTGKSTCCRRLSRTWQTRCDDGTLVVLDVQRRYLAHPFPTWSDFLWQSSEQTWRVEWHVPLSAIFFLEQAEIDEAVPVGPGQGAVLMTRSAMEVYQPNWIVLAQEKGRNIRKKLFDNACELAKSIPAFKLRVSLNGQFWKEIEKVLP